MEEVSLSKKLASNLLENQNIELTVKGKPKINGLHFSRNGWESSFIKKFILEDKRVLKDIDPELLILPEKDLVDTFKSILPETFDILVETITDRKVKEVTSDLNIVSHRETYLHAIPVVDMSDKDGTQIMVDGKTGRVLDLSAKSWAAIVGTEHVGYQGGGLNIILEVLRLIKLLEI